jgi:hypothetical protein
MIRYPIVHRSRGALAAAAFLAAMLASLMMQAAPARAAEAVIGLL